MCVSKTSDLVEARVGQWGTKLTLPIYSGANHKER